jgi:hypothetical protein
VVDSLDDGRIIALASGAVWIETTPASGTFANVGTLPSPDFPSFGAAFVRVSPDGTQFAVGNNGGASFGNYQVGVFSVATLTGTWFSANHFDAEWIDDRYLAITAGDFVNPSVVTVLDTQSPIPASPVNVTVVNNIGGASSGIVFDSAGRLYTGNGFTGAGPSGTGAVRAFPFAAWNAAFLGGPVVNFETSGSLVVDVLSASPLAMDTEGNLVLGGGDFSESDQFDFAALVRATAIGIAISGGPPATPSDPAQVRQWDPDTANNSNYYSVQYNAALRRAYVYDSSTTALHIYQDATGIPAVSQWGMINATLGLLILGTQIVRRRNAALFSAS